MLITPEVAVQFVVLLSKPAFLINSLTIGLLTLKLAALEVLLLFAASNALAVKVWLPFVKVVESRLREKGAVRSLPFKALST